MLVIALALTGYASFDRNLPSGLNLRLGAVNAEGLAIGEGGSSGSVVLGRSGTIVKPIGVPTQAIPSHAPVAYQVQPGEKLADIATRFKVSVSSIRWSNFATLRSLGADVSAGQTIVVPPVEGVVVTVNSGDSPQSLGATYAVDAGSIIDFNYLRTAPGAALVAGAIVVVPGGHGPAFDKVVSVAPVAAPATRSSSGGGSGGSLTSGIASWSPSSGNRFAFGYCTWYVANRRPVPWLGNASAWFSQAQLYGWRTGQTPAVGAIMVTMESGWGHVAYVESVSGSSWTVSEMNYKAWDVVDFRTINPGQVPLIGFIYGP